jgi:hypothetical protein
MKSKFDKIMANFIDENKKSGREENGISEFKEKNMKKNVKGIF